MKRWQIIVVAGAGLAAVAYVGTHTQQLGFAGPQAIGADDRRDTNEPPTPAARPPAIVWTKLDRSAEGFRVDMPADVKQIEVPAYNESGSTDAVNMIFSNPDADVQFSVAWEDNPPVARVSNQTPDRTLEMAREGAVARTQTVLVSESSRTTQGYPGREFEARNSGGGVMNSRLIYAGTRLYMLNAAFPSASARRDKDVRRFFNSFVVTSTPGGGKAEPAAPSKAGL